MYGSANGTRHKRTKVRVGRIRVESSLTEAIDTSWMRRDATGGIITRHGGLCETSRCS